jgi:hypothetical protein
MTLSGHSPPYSITSSGVICMIMGTVKPSGFAVLKLITSSNFADWPLGSRSRSGGSINQYS